MPAEADNADATLRNEHELSIDKYGAKAVNKLDKTRELNNKVHAGHEHDDKPAGGFDDTPVKKAPAGYTIKITFHSASDLPFADLSMTSDPYIHATLKTDLLKRHKQDPDLSLRTPTVHRNVDPVWNTEWIIAHVPASGFHLKLRLYDEDPTDRDDRLGNVHVNVNRIDESWQGFKEQRFDIKKRMGSKRAYTLRGCMSLFSDLKMDGHVIVSVENLGRSEGDGGRAYTIGPLLWKQHHSPLIGRIAGIKDDEDDKGVSKYNFQAIQLQLRGPVPAPLYHRYVEFRPFVAGMFTSHTLRGKFLNHALHHQHARIYNYDTSTKYGSFEEPCAELTNKFLEFVHYDQGGRIFTYVLTLDAQMRFTETGKEFGVDLLSKHTMHSDVSSYIAFSGEFFVRRLKHPRKDKSDSPDPATEAMPPAPSPGEEKSEHQNEKETHHDRPSSSTSRPHAKSESSSNKQGTLRPTLSPETEKRKHSFFRNKSTDQNSERATSSRSKPTDGSKDAANYELVIDNDSGTYRPNAKYLPDLKKFLAANFKGLRVVTLDCQKDEEKMKKLKDEQRERKKKEGKQITYMQNSSMSSISSSDEEALERRANNNEGIRGRTQQQWQKLKHLGHDDDDERSNHDEKAHANSKDGEDGPTHDVKTDLSTAQKDGQSDRHAAELPNQRAVHANAASSTREKKQSISTDADADHQSFQTAFTDDHAHEQFVTPKPSLGDGGLKQFDDDGPETPKAKQHDPLSFVHHAVTQDAR